MNNYEDEDEGTMEPPTFLKQISEKLEEQKQKQLKDLENKNEDEQFKIDVENLKQLFILGQGTFGVASVVLDQQSGIKYAKKQFKELNHYLDEKNLIQRIMNTVGKRFNKIGAGLEKFDNKSLTLYYKCGECSLEDLIKIRGCNQIWWWDKQSEIAYIIQELFKQFKVLFECDVYHTDLKPANIILEKLVDKNFRITYQIKLIDFGSTVFNFNEITSLTAEFYPYDYEKFIPYKEKIQRIKAENYTLGRTIQRILISSICYSEQIQTDSLFKNNPESIKECLEKLNTYYDQNIVEILQMLLEQQDPESIEKKLDQLYGEKIYDGGNLIQKLLIEKQLVNIGQIKENNIDKEIKICMRNFLYDRAKQILENIGQKNIQKNIDLIFLQINLYHKIGNFQLMRDFLKEVEQLENQFEWSKPKEALENLKYQRLRIYLQYTYNREQRYEKMEDIKQKLIEFGGERKNKYLAFFYYFNGLMKASSGKKDQKYYYQGLNDLNKSNELCQEINDGEESFYQAQNYRYIGQIYFLQYDYELATQAYEKEEQIRIKFEQANSPELACVKNCLASCYSSENNSYEKSLSMIEEVLQIYVNSIGIMNQLYCLALQWKAFYLSKLKREDESIEIWEYTLFLAFQIFGENNKLYTVIQKSHIKKKYDNIENAPERIKTQFIDKMEEQIKMQNIDQAYIYFVISKNLYEQHDQSENADQQKIVEEIQQILLIRKEFFIKKQNQKKFINVLDQINSIREIEQMLPDHMMQEIIENKIKRLRLIHQLPKYSFQEISYELNKAIESIKEKIVKEDQNKEIFKQGLFNLMVFKVQCYKYEFNNLLKKRKNVSDQVINHSYQTEEAIQELKILAQTEQEKKYCAGIQQGFFYLKMELYLQKNLIKQVIESVYREMANSEARFGKYSKEHLKFIFKIAELMESKGQLYESKKIYKLLQEIAINLNDEFSIQQSQIKQELIFQKQKQELKLKVSQAEKNQLIKSLLQKNDFLENTQKQKNEQTSQQPELILQSQDLNNFNALTSFTKFLQNQ